MHRSRWTSSTGFDGLLAIDAADFVIGAGPAALAAAARPGLPLAGTIPIAKAGGIIGYSVDYAPMSRYAANFVDKILKETKPGDIPIEQATKFITIVNLKNRQGARPRQFRRAGCFSADQVIE